MNINLQIPEKVLEKLKQRILSEEKTIEEVILEAILEIADFDNPDIRYEVHLGLSKKYLQEGEGLLGKGDFVQASEKGWGAASQMVKALSAKEGVRLRSHGELNEYVDRLCEQKGDIEIDRLWRSALSLHQNFHESWLPPRSVKRAMEDVKAFMEKLKNL